MADETPRKPIRPRVARACRMCGGEYAYGPHFRAADGVFPVKRLRFDCCTCGFISCDPTADATPEEAAQVRATEATLLEKWRGGDGYERRERGERQPTDNRSRDIQDIVNSETRSRFRRGGY